MAQKIFILDLSITITFGKLIGCYHIKGPERPPRNPLGILRALLVMRMKGIRSLRELTRILDVDRRIRRLCLIRRNERRYTWSVISRFTRRIEAKRLQLIIDDKVAYLLRRSPSRRWMRFWAPASSRPGELHRE